MLQCMSLRLTLVKLIGLTHPSDHTLPADKQAEQIMSIYPIVDGQKAEEDAPAPRAAAPNVEEGEQPPPVKEQQNDLIDFGASDEPAKSIPAAEKKATETEHEPSEIEKMLNSTSKPAQGPLLDFTSDLKKDLPSGKAQPQEDLLS